MSFYINFRNRDQPALEKVLRRSHPGGTSRNIRELLESDYHFDEADGSINAASDIFLTSDAETLYKDLAKVRVPVYGVLLDEFSRFLYAVAGNRWASADALPESGYPAVRVNPDGSIERECISEAVHYWEVFRDAYRAIHGREAIL